MRLYYRSDTRPPETIFLEGFTPRNELVKNLDSKQKWWMFGLQQTTPYGNIAVSDLHLDPLTKQTMDAASNYVICMTSEFEAAPIFPILPDASTGDPYSEIYVYVIALPDAIYPDNKECPDIEVFDLHRLQIQQAKQILKNHPQENPAFVTQGLCGYEAFAKKVKPQEIICAVKCKRSDLLPKTAGLEVFTSTENYAQPFDRSFQMGHEIFYNSHYVEREEGLKEAASKKLRAVKQKGIQQTKSVIDALKESGIEYEEKYVKRSTLFWNELVHLNFIGATLSVFDSIRYFFISLFKFLTCQSIFDPEDTRIGENTTSLSLSESSGQYTKSELLNNHGILGNHRSKVYPNNLSDENGFEKSSLTGLEFFT